MKKLVSAFALVACVGVLGAGAYPADSASAADSIDYVKDGKVYMPNTKVEYDLHGFIQNVYYLTPGTTDSYQLEKPQQYTE